MPPEAVADKTGASPAGASSGVTTTGNITSGTASEALIKAASSAAESTTESVTPATTKAGDTTPTGEVKADPTTTAAATVQPKADGPADKATATGEAPEARITAATRNARTTLLQTIGDSVGLGRPLAEGDLKDLKTGMGLLTDLRDHAEEFFLSLGKELGYEIPQQAAETYTMPKPSLKSEDGREAYSAEEVSQIADIIERKVTAKLMGEMQPLIGDREARATETARESVIRESRTLAGQALTEAREMPHFKEHEPAISERMRALTTADPQLRQRIGAIGVLYRAYNEILKEKVFPSIDTSAETRIREDNARKAAGSTIVHPTGSSGDGKKVELRGVDDLARHMERMANA